MASAAHRRIEPLLYSIADLQLVLGGISRRKIERMLSSGELGPPVRIGDRRFVEVCDVERFIASRKDLVPDSPDGQEPLFLAGAEWIGDD